MLPAAARTVLRITIHRPPGAQHTAAHLFPNGMKKGATLFVHTHAHTCKAEARTSPDANQRRAVG